MIKRVLPFAIAGGFGFLADAGVLLLVSDTLGPFAGRLVSFLCGVATTWVINRNFAFADRRSDQGLGREFVRYFFAMLPGAAVNWLGYTLAISLVTVTPTTLTLAVAIGSLAGMAANLAAANWLVFRAPR